MHLQLQQSLCDWIDTPVHDASVWRRKHSISNSLTPSRVCVLGSWNSANENQGSSFFWQAELTFCAGDVITVFGEIDEDGFYYVSIMKFEYPSTFNALFSILEKVDVFQDILELGNKVLSFFTIGEWNCTQKSGGMMVSNG